ncbi:transposase [Cohnella yongneupensis]|uniref:Transposase n=1 Tax=Cohnella yongneupensis TaxID=425006 RepID=A0ABW0R6Q1_9BACL
MTYEAFCSSFETEEDCMQALFKVKWPDGFRCPICSNTNCYVTSTRRLPLYECARCRTQTSLISDTIFRGSRTPLRSWFRAIFLHTQWRGINALQLSEKINVSYKTAWLICHKIRFAMSQSDAENLLSGIVRVSDAILYRRIIPPRNFLEFEQPVFVGSMEDEHGEITRFKIRVSPRSLRKDRHSSPDASSFIQQVVVPTSIPGTIVTKRHGKEVNRELRWVCRDAERWMASKFRGVGLKHLQVYLDHYCYIDSRQEDSSIFIDLLRDCVRRVGINYPKLTGTLNRRSSRPVRQKHAAIALVG